MSKSPVRIIAFNSFNKSVIFTPEIRKAMITYHKGDLLKADAEALRNTVKTVGIMGKGVALAFKNSFSHNYLAYRKAFAAKQLAFGRLLVINVQNPLSGKKIIINLPTKPQWRLPSEYGYIVQGLSALRTYLTKNARWLYRHACIWLW